MRRKKAPFGGRHAELVWTASSSSRGRAPSAPQVDRVLGRRDRPATPTAPIASPSTTIRRDAYHRRRHNGGVREHPCGDVVVARFERAMLRYERDVLQGPGRTRGPKRVQGRRHPRHRSALSRAPRRAGGGVGMVRQLLHRLGDGICQTMELPRDATSDRRSTRTAVVRREGQQEHARIRSEGYTRGVPRERATRAWPLDYLDRSISFKQTS